MSNTLNNQFKQLKALFSLIALLFLGLCSQAQTADSIASLLCKVIMDESKPSVRFEWESRFNPQSYQVFRRNAYSGNFTLLSNLDGNAVSYEDLTFELGRVYEYRIVRNSASGLGTAFLSVGHEIPHRANRGQVLILATRYILDSLIEEVNQYQMALISDGWQVRLEAVAANDNVSSVSGKIQQVNTQSGGQLRSIILLGNIPVPYSGNMAPDGHVPDHQGAWPADGYYGANPGGFSDFLVDITVAARPQNHNVPGDGKFDQNEFPNQVRFEIGRIDFSKLPAFQDSEIELTRKYLLKNIAFRKGEIPTQRRGIIQNNFAGFPEGFGQSGLRNFQHLLRAENTRYGNYRTELLTEPFMWSYGCGPGSYTSAGGIINTSNLTTDSLQTIFTMIFGSYFGDWDTQNNLLRAALASGTVLTNAWAGRPAWVFHPMGLGETIGFCARMTQNNTNGTYGTAFQRSTHSALIGDPTLHMYPLQSVKTANIEETEMGIKLNWDYPENIVKRFHIFRKLPHESDFVQITVQPIEEKYFIDSCHLKDQRIQYLIREIALQNTPTGSFYNIGHGHFLEIITQTESYPQAAFDYTQNDLEITMINFSSNATDYLWSFGDGGFSTEQNPTHQYESPGIYEITLRAQNSCGEDSITVEVTKVVNQSKTERSELEIDIYPNPIYEDLIITFPSGLRNADLSLQHINGNVVFHTRSGENEQLILPLKLLPAGVYFLIIEHQMGKKVEKIIKLR